MPITYDASVKTARMNAVKTEVGTDGKLKIRDSANNILATIGLGSGGADTRSRLRRAILGFDRDDLYLIPPASVGIDNDATDDDAPDTLP